MKEEKPVAVAVVDSTIRRCNCDHAFQDKTYGTKMRVMTPGLKYYKCTVCSAKYERKA